MAMPEVDVAEAPRKTGVSLEGSPRIQCGFCGNLYVKDAAYCRKCGGKRDGMDSSADMEYDSMCGLELTHASGVYPLPIRDACISLGDDALAFAVGRHIAVWDHVKKRLKFIGRKQENCVITAMAKSASGRLLAVAERQGSSNDSRETGNVQISIVGLPAAWARAEDGSMVQQKEGVLKVLYPSNKRSKINALGFSADGRRLVSVSDMPDTSITYWKWETEKAIATHNVQLPITRLHVNPKNGQQISLSGCNYCRIWEFNPNDHHLRENASVFSLKEEKMTDVVDHNWVVVKEEAFLIVATREGHVHVFQDGERTEDIDVQGVIAKDESTGPKAAAREQAKVMAKMMGGVGPTAAKEPPPVSLMSLAVWGQGFVVGGDQGYLGVFKVGGLGQVEPFGTFRMPGEESFLWSMSAGSEDTYLNILSYTERDAERDPTKTAGVPKMVRSATSGFGGGRASRQGSMMPSEEQEPDDDKERVWSFSTFPVSQADLASTGQLDVFVPMVPMGLHHGSVNALATCHSRRIVATCGNDYMLKLWSFPEDGALDAPNAFGCEFSVQVSTYEKPTSLAVHPLGFQVAVVLQDMLRIYHVTAQQSSRTMFDLPLKHPGDVSYSHSGELLAVSQNNDVILIDPIKGVLVRIFSGSGGHLSFVNQVGFSADDKMLLSCSAAPSGAIYGWDLESEAKDRIFEHVSKGTDYAAFAHDFRRNLCCAIARPQGSLRMIGHLNNTVEEILPEGPNATYTAISLGAPIGHLFAGTQQGHVRIFEWPLKPGGAQANPFIQVELHAHSITSLSLCSNGRFLYSSCKGGAVLASRVKAFTFASGEKEELTPALLDQRFTRYRRREDGEKKQKSKREDDRKAHDLQKKLYEALSSSASNTASLDDLVMLPKSYFQELLTEIKHLEERHLSLKHESEHALEQKDVELSDKLEQMQHERKNETEQHDEKYDSLFDQHKKALKRSEDEMRKANGEFAKRSRNTEDDHDGKMSKEFEKQSLLLGELQTLRDHDQQKLLLVEEKHSQQLEDLRSAHENAMREWKTEYEKVCNLLKSDGLKFEEAMRQQEVEYEDQITDMLEVKRAVLQVESEKSTTAFKDAVSMKQTISMLQGNIVEYTAKFEQSERQKSDLRQQLEASREMFANVQEQLKEEKRALKVKNENLGKLREQMKHLESFRFVLFHKVKMMEEERDPLAEQVSSLKHNVREMYSEFVREFRNKQTLDQELTDKKVLTSSLQQENILVTRHLIQLKKDGRRLLNDVEAILHAETAAEFEKMPKRLMAMLEKYKSLSQWKAPVDDHAIEPDDLTKEQLMMNEMVIQRDLLFRKNEISKSASTQIKRECGVDLRRLSSENAALIAEMNTLRSENRSLVRSCKDQEAAIIAMRAKEKAKRMIDSVGEGGFLAHSESAPALDGGGGAGGSGGAGGALGSRKSSGMLRGGNSSGTVGGAVASETPYLRRKVVDKEEVKRRQQQKGMNMLPPVQQASSQEKRFAQNLDAGSVAKQRLESQGFDVGRLAEVASASADDEGA